jgi:hypothetical protein
MNILLDFMKTYHLAQKLLVRDRQLGDLISLGLLRNMG